LYMGLLMTILAFVCPNLGGLARYRMGGYVFYVYLIFCPISEYLDKKKLFQSFYWKSLKIKF
jgi:hypothetical protein